MATKKGWGEVDKPRSGGDSRFVACAAGESVTLRIIDMEPDSFRVHQIATVNSSGEEVFRQIQETDKPDDDYIDQHTNRFPAMDRHAIRCVIYDEDGEPDQIKILVGGKQIFKQLKQLFDKHGDITEFDVELSREGKGRETTWTIGATPKSHDIDVEEWQEELENDSQWEYENLFPSITPEQQQKILEEADIDITYDPVVEIMEEMTLKEATKTRLTFGKYGPEKMPPNGKTVGQIWKIDQGWIIWAAQNVTSNDQVAAACRFMVDNTKAVEKGSEETKEIASGKKDKRVKDKKKGKKDKKKAKAEPEPSEEEGTEEEEEDGSPQEEIDRDSWEGEGYKGTPEKYLARWFGKGGKEAQIDLAIEILKSEGLEWDADKRASFDPDEKVDEPEDEEDDDEGYDPDEMDRDEMFEVIKEIFAEDYDDPTEIVDITKKFGKGKSRLRDLKEKQMRKLLNHLLED